MVKKSSPLFFCENLRGRFQCTEILISKINPYFFFSWRKLDISEGSKFSLTVPRTCCKLLNHQVNSL